MTARALIGQLIGHSRILRHSAANAERTVGKRRRESSDNSSSTDKTSCIPDISAIHNLLSDFPAQPNLIAFYLAWVCDVVEFDGQKDISLANVVEFLGKGFISKKSHYSAELNLSVLEVLSNLVSRQCHGDEILVRAFWDIASFTRNRPGSSSSESSGASLYFLDAKLPHENISSQVLLHGYSFIRSYIPLCPASQLDELYGLVKFLVTYHVGHHVAKVSPVDVLSDDDELLFAFLLAQLDTIVLCKSFAPIAWQPTLLTMREDAIQNFLQLITAVIGYDETLLVEFICSDETEALKYVLRALKIFACSDLEDGITQTSIPSGGNSRKNDKLSLPLKTSNNVLLIIDEILIKNEEVNSLQWSARQFSIAESEWQRDSGDDRTNVDVGNNNDRNDDEDSDSEIGVIDHGMEIAAFFHRFRKLIYRKHKMKTLPFNPTPFIKALDRFISS